MINVSQLASDDVIDHEDEDGTSDVVLLSCFSLSLALSKKL